MRSGFCSHCVYSERDAIFVQQWSVVFYLVFFLKLVSAVFWEQSGIRMILQQKMSVAVFWIRIVTGFMKQACKTIWIDLGVQRLRLFASQCLFLFVFFLRQTAETCVNHGCWFGSQFAWNTLPYMCCQKVVNLSINQTLQQKCSNTKVWNLLNCDSSLLSEDLFLFFPAHLLLRGRKWLLSVVSARCHFVFWRRRFVQRHVSVTQLNVYVPSPVRQLSVQGQCECENCVCVLDSVCWNSRTRMWSQKIRF